MKIGSMGIIKKITIIFILTIIIPVSIIMAVMYYQFFERETASILRHQSNSLDVISEKLDHVVMVTENLADIIRQNPRLVRYLSTADQDTFYSLKEYHDLVSPLLRYSLEWQMVKIHSITVVVHDPEVEPIGYMFIRDDVWNDRGWYDDFLDSPKEALWLPPESKDSLFGEEESSRRVITYCKKVHSPEGDYLGIVAIHMYEDDFFRNFRQFQDDQNTVHVLNSGGADVYISNPDQTPVTYQMDFEARSDTPISYVRNREIYSYQFFQDIDMYIGIITTMEGMMVFNNATILSMLAITVVLLILILLFYRYLRNVFRTIQGKIRKVNDIIQDDFKERLPIERTDDIGDISRSFNVLLDKINLLITDVVNKETAQNEAKLMALQYQINPHFIYNTIEVFSNKMELAGEYDTSDALAAFGKMLRYNLKSDSSFTLLKEEIAHVKSYLQIEQLRKENNLTVNMYYPNDIVDNKIIKFILQPVIENCFAHGFKHFNDHMHIDINILSQEGYIHFSIADNGLGIPPDRLELLNEAFKTSDYSDPRFKRPGSNSIGLRNINERLKLFYNNACYITLSTINNYTVVSFRLPILSE